MYFAIGGWALSVCLIGTAANCCRGPIDKPVSLQAFIGTLTFCTFMFKREQEANLDRLLIQARRFTIKHNCPTLAISLSRFAG